MFFYFSVNASRRCTAEGVWEMKTDYNDCMAGAREQVSSRDMFSVHMSHHPHLMSDASLDRVQPGGHK